MTTPIACHAAAGSGLPHARRAPLLAALLALLLVPLLAVSALAQTEGGYRLRPGDVLSIEVVEDAGLNRSALIAPDGRITLPLAGSVTAAGRTVEAVQADLVQRLTGSFATAPTVFVSIDQLAQDLPATEADEVTIDIYVVGEVAGAGRLDVKPGTTVLQAFAQMGGFTPFAATKRLQLRRGAKIWHLNYKAIEAGTSRAGDTMLQAGDVIVVPQRRLFE